MAVPVPGKQRAPPGLHVGPQRTPLGAGRRRGESGGGRGSRAPLTWQRRSEHLAEPSPSRPGARLGCPCSERPGPPKQPAAARNSPAVATAPPPLVCQARSQLHGAEPWDLLAAPRLLPPAAQSGEGDATGVGGVGGGGLCRPGAEPGELGAGPSGVRSDLTAARRKPSRPRYGGSAAGQLGRGDHAGHRQDFPPASGRLRVGGR